MPSTPQDRTNICSQIKLAMAEQLLLLTLLSVALSYVASTTVTFSHGGQLLGKQFQYDGVAVDLFLGK